MLFAALSCYPFAFPPVFLPSSTCVYSFLALSGIEGHLCLFAHFSLLLSVESLHLLLWPIVAICKERIRFEYVRWMFIAGIRTIAVAMYYMRADKEGKVSFMVCAINHYWLYKWPPLYTTLSDVSIIISSSSQIVYDLLFFLYWLFFFVHLFCKTLLLKFPITIFNENGKLQTPLIIIETEPLNLWRIHETSIKYL